MIRIRHGLDLPIEGEPKPEIDAAPPVRRVALVGDDYIGMKPTMAVREGDAVKLGQVLFYDKKSPGIQYTSPASGQVLAIVRGPKRKFESMIVQLDGEDEVSFESFEGQDITGLAQERVRKLLVQSGLWTALRTRPYSKVPSPESTPHSIFVTAMDTRPLAVPPELVIEERPFEFERGLHVLGRLTDGPLFVCTAPGMTVPGHDAPRVRVEAFAGPHPAGLPGTHIHFLDAVHTHKTVWYINYQDVIAVGRLFSTGRIAVDRVISLGGPAARKPRLLRTRLGASIEELVEEELEEGNVRVISGSVLSGRKATGNHAFLGRYHLQMTALKEGHQRVFLDWLKPGMDRFSIKNAFASAWSNRSRRFPFTTSREGSRRAMVPIGMYEQVVPLDIIPTFLLRALIVGDTERAQSLGCLELDEEDVALCTFVCPGKYEYGPILRQCLTRIEQEG